MAPIKRMNLEIVKTILKQIHEQGKSKRTRLALACKLPYDRFVKYLTIMLTLELVLLEDTTDGIFVHITTGGKKFLEHSL